MNEAVNCNRVTGKIVFNYNGKLQMTAQRNHFHIYLLKSSLIFLFLASFSLQAQSIEEGIRNYKQQNYEEAAEIFSRINTPEALLFAGKSFYALRRYDDAENVLDNLLQDAPPRLYYEAAYTSALVNFQQKQFGLSLNKLFRVSQESSDNLLSGDAEQLYNQVLGYLSAEQRLAALEAVDADQIRFQLTESALGKVDYSAVEQLISKFYSTADDETWRSEMEDLETSLTNTSAYKVEYGDAFNVFTPPDGTIYNIGVALPKFSADNANYEVIRGLFLGAKMAVDAFNQSHSNAKAYLSYLPSGSSNLEELVATFTDGNYGDIIIGPLFSDNAATMVDLSSEYEIPVIAPLANSRVESSGSLFFQANSTFPVHGKMMARFAVNHLNMRNFAVIAGENTKGALSAAAFREEAEALGGNVVYYFTEDLAAGNYDISVYFNRFGTDAQPIDAIYAPFTGERAPYLIEQLVTYANTPAEPITLLGSQKWSEVNFISDVYGRGAIYFTTGEYRNGSIGSFQTRFNRNFNVTPNKFALIGYDVMHYILQVLDEAGNPAALAQSIKQDALYRGFIKNIKFNGTHVNHAVHVLKVASNGRFDLQHWR